jgi:hypothetical protein
MHRAQNGSSHRAHVRTFSGSVVSLSTSPQRAHGVARSQRSWKARMASDASGATARDAHATLSSVSRVSA